VAFISGVVGMLVKVGCSWSWVVVTAVVSAWSEPDDVGSVSNVDAAVVAVTVSSVSSGMAVSSSMMRGEAGVKGMVVMVGSSWSFVVAIAVSALSEPDVIESVGGPDATSVAVSSVSSGVAVSSSMMRGEVGVMGMVVG
jgi:hypothetical protein